MSIDGYIVVILVMSQWIYSEHRWIYNGNTTSKVVIFVIICQWIHSGYICRLVANSVPTLNCIATSILVEFSYILRWFLDITSPPTNYTSRY